MKKIFGLLAAGLLACGTAQAQSPVAISAIITNGSCYFTNNYSFTVLGLTEIDVSSVITNGGAAMTTNFTATLYNVSGAITTTQSLGTITATSGSGTLLLPNVTTNTVTFTATPWAYTNASSAAAVTVAGTNVIRGISVINMVGTATTGLVSIAQIGITNVLPFTLNSGSAIANVTDIGTVSPATVTASGIGTNVCTIAVQISATGPTGSSTGTQYGGQTFIMMNRFQSTLSADSALVTVGNTNISGVVTFKGLIYR